MRTRMVPVEVALTVKLVFVTCTRCLNFSLLSKLALRKPVVLALEWSS